VAQIIRENILSSPAARFKYAPPLKGVRKSKRLPPDPPYRDAPKYKCSVYYYWWEYLKRHEGYKQTCIDGGVGEYQALYRDFGNVHNGDGFMTWWRSHDHLFAEPYARKIQEIEGGAVKRQGALELSIPLEVQTGYLVKLFKKILSEHSEEAIKLRNTSLAMYPVATKPVLRSLHMHLKIWDIKNENPNLKHYEIADIVGVKVYNMAHKGEARKRLSTIISRHLRIAEQYIEYVVLGEFPERYRR